MKRIAIWKDFFMEIKTSLNRFLSIFFIVALGVAFFAGIRATDPDMRLTADSYYDSSNLMDIRILSTLGLTEEDVTAIAEVNGVKTVEPSYSTHVVSDISGNELVLEVLSSTEKLNLINVIEGRMPEKREEVLVDQFFIRSTGYRLGDKIKLASGTDQPLSDTLNQEEFTIVGVGTTAYYLSFQRGSSNIGTGDVNSFVVVKPEVFNHEVYTTVYIEVDGAKEMTVYTEEYENRIEEVKDNIEAIASDRNQLRYDEIYQEAYAEIDKSEKELQDAKAKAEAETEAALANPQLAFMSEEQKQAFIEKLEEGNEEAQAKFLEAEEKINDAKAELTKLKLPKWHVLDRGSNEAYVEFEQNANRIGAIGEVFPAIFFLVAALISLTTMARMVEEQRIQIGTLKALGYSKKAIAAKYMLYALIATLGGSAFGAVVGLKVLPNVIIKAYTIMYRNIPEVITPFNLYYATLATVLAVLCVGLATFLSCYKELLAKPAQLMRPEAPKNGKRVLLERIPFIWNRLSFTWKATIRNLMRYKKRFFMTIFGIGGCMALLLVGFGLMDSIFVINTRQFDEIMLYEASVMIDKEASPSQLEKLETAIKDNSDIRDSLRVRTSSVDITFKGTTKQVSMYVPEDVQQFDEYIVFRKRIGHDKLVLKDDGVILTEQISKKLGVKVGDSIKIKDDEIEVQAKVTGITENYMTHYLYITPSLYEVLFEKDVTYNEYFLMLQDDTDSKEAAVGNKLLKEKATSSVFYVSNHRTLLGNVLKSLNIVLWVLIISAGSLAFVVLYNLNNININERRRELATIKVLGFYNPEMAAYVYRENILLTMIGAVFGVFFGILLHRFVIITVEIDLVMFGRNIDPSSYLYSILLTFLFSALVNFVMYFKLRKINMVESLKSVE